MKDEHIIINKTKWLEVLENNKKLAPHWDGVYVSDAQNARAELIEEILSQSTPLIPEIEKAFDAGCSYAIGSHENFKQTYHNKKEYISNLKIK